MLDLRLRGMLMNDTIDYGNLMHDAMRGLIATVLNDVGEHGLPGEHHFFITYDTTHPDADMPDWLKERYPEEITIVIQHWFDGLIVDGTGFSVTLNFGDQPVPLYVPFDALMNFVDPSVEFGLVFRQHSDDEDDNPADLHIVEQDDISDDDDAPMGLDTPDEAPGHKADVVSLDSFRK